MRRRTHEIPKPSLTPRQAADVITFFQRFESTPLPGEKPPLQISVGHAGIRATIVSGDLLPENAPLLHTTEALSGVAYLEETSDDDQEQINRLVDSGMVSYYEARKIITGK